MTNEDYQLEELENAAVNKSGNAKRIAAAAGLFATGGAAGFAATQIPTGEEEVPDPLLTEDIDEGANAGVDQVEEPKTQAPAPKTETPPVDEPKEEPEPEPEVTFDKTTHYYDENHNLVASAEEGTIDGKDFALYDFNGDMRADALAYDENGNGVYEDHEFLALEGRDQIVMGHEATTHDDVFLASNEPEPIEPIDPYDPWQDIDDDKDDWANNNNNDDIHNDFEDEKTGEDYSHDYADNNGDYDNGEDDNGEEAYGYANIAADDTADGSFDDLGSDSFDIV